jgi:hypothetical protein
MGISIPVFPNIRVGIFWSSFFALAEAIVVCGAITTPAPARAEILKNCLLFMLFIVFDNLIFLFSNKSNVYF